MNEQQTAWTGRHCRELKAYLDKTGTLLLSGRQCEAVQGYIDVVVFLSNDNAEVRSALFDVLEEFEERRRKNE